MKQLLPLIALLILVLFLAGWWNVYKYQECKKVGHATTYCILILGEK